MEGNNQENNERAATDEYFRSLPPGIRFQPTDRELILNYLKPKVLNEPLPRNRIRTLYIYDFHPRQLCEDPEFERIREDGWYFFTTRKRKYLNGTRPNRKADDGYWKAVGGSKTIEDENDQVIGQRSALDYRIGVHPQSIKTDWKMYEYTLHEDEKADDIPLPMRKIGEGNMKLDLVLCKIYINSRATGNTNDDDAIATENSDQGVVTDAAGQAQHAADSSLIYNLQPQVHNNITEGFNHLDHISDSSSTPENGFCSSASMSNGVYDHYTNCTHYGESMHNGASGSVHQWGSSFTQLHQQDYYSMYSETMPSSSSTSYPSYEHPSQYSLTEIQTQLQPVNHEMSRVDDLTLASLPAHVIEYNSMLVNNKDEADQRMPFTHEADDDGLQFLCIPDEVHQNDSKTGEDDPKTD